MKVKSLITLFLASTALLFLDSCSRESPIKENTGLKNNHSRVFVSKEPFKDPQAFLDSMANTAVVASDTIPDTLTITINDTIHLLGMLPRYVEKIYRFQWNLTKADGKDSIMRVSVDNYGKPIKWSYAKEGLYYPIFVAFDGNNASDTAGSGSKRVYINVIDTDPVLGVPQDTLWTSHDGDVNFSIFAADSFGTIKKLKIDLDASGKDSAQTWKYDQEGDSLFITIKNDKKYIDSKGNQTIYVIVEDDDGNETKDSIYLHYNRKPTLKIISPLDSSRHNINQLFQFFYESTDEDNPQDLRYYIYAQKSKNGQPPTTAFQSKDLIAKNINTSIYEPEFIDGKTRITLIDDTTNTELEGRIYWDMYVTDGYDIVRMERIPYKDTTSRTWNFFIGDLSSTQGTFTGFAKYQGRDNHAGIRVEFNNGSKLFTTFTKPNGSYAIKVDIGEYEVRASSDTIKEYLQIFDTLYIEGATVKVDDLILRDTASPALVVTPLDTLNIREKVVDVYGKDLASRLESTTFKLDDEPINGNCKFINDNVIVTCTPHLKEMKDGKHVLEIIAKDKVGNTNLYRDTFFVAATQLDFDVNGKQKDRIGENSSNDLVFTAQVSNAYPEADEVVFTWKIKEDSHTETVSLDESGKATYTLKFTDLANAETGEDYSMTVSYKSNGADIAKTVAFGILGHDPTVLFTKPGKELQVTMNDPIDFEIVAYPGEENPTIVSKVWNCTKATLAQGYTCPAEGSEAATLAFGSTKKQEISVTIKDGAGTTSTDVITIDVISDVPTIKASTGDKSNEYKINKEIPIAIESSDKFGTVNSIKWGCTTGNLNANAIIDFSNTLNLTSPAKTFKDTIKINMPGKEADGKTYTCIFVAVDDDKEEGYDTLTFIPLIDLPTLKLGTKKDDVKINSEQTIKAYAKDILGEIVKYEYACDENLAGLKNPVWDEMFKDSVKVTMPSVATNFYCVVQVTDDDNNSVKDTVTYNVLVGRPVVKAQVNYTKVTINDEVELSAFAQDSLGSIDSYEWGCGPKGATSIGFSTYSKTSTKSLMKMPSDPYEEYRCIIKVTDDDENVVMDTVSIEVIQAPPTVTVRNKSLVIRPKYNIALSATASDNNGVPSDPGEIVKREWSCGLPEQIESNWKVVSEFDTTWKAPDFENNRFVCMARATDNDGNTATDKMTFTFSSETPVITTKDNMIYVVKGDGFTLDATINNVWQGINWFRWDCYDAATKKTLEPEEKKYDYAKNKNSFEFIKNESYSMKDKDMYCVVTAEEASTKAEFTDTTYVKIMRNYPKGVISAADTVYIWSGDEKQVNEARYFYSPSWGGGCSKRGDLSNPSSPQAFYWNFSNVDDKFYKGNPNGSIDTNEAQFNSAFIRSKTEGSMTIRLDYRDSVSSVVTESFLVKHRAPEVARTVYFKKAWQNLGKDTVVETTSSLVAPAFVTVGNKPVVAYVTSDGTVKAVSFNGTTWNNEAPLSFKISSATVKSIKLATDGTNLYLAALTSGKEILVKKSANATSAFADMGSITNAKEPELLWDSKNKNPIVAYVGDGGSNNNKARIAKYGTSSWSSVNVTSKSNTATHVKAAFNSDASKLFVAALDTISYTTRFYVMNNLASAGDPTATMNEVNKISLAIDGSTLYIAYMNRNEDKTFVRKYNISNSSLTGANDLNNFSGMLRSYHTSIVAKNGIVYLALDDKAKPNQAQTHIYRYENNAWHYHGENQLPYFGSQFYKTNGYYLRGSSPALSMDSNGGLYVVMLAQVQKMYNDADELIGSDTNNGPIVMKYIADTWNVTPLPPTCEDIE